MTRAQRLAEILRLLRRQEDPQRAGDLARALGVSVRTIYRDMERLAAAGVPVEGTRGAGYRLSRLVALPPVALAPEELEALQLGIAIVAEADDPDLRAAAERLADKIDAALPEQARPEDWPFAALPGGDAARGFSLMGTLRSAIRGRQKLRIVHPGGAGPREHRLRPLRLDHMGRIWMLTGWSETVGDFALFRVDLIEAAVPLPELFVEEAGRRLEDMRR